MRQWQNVKAHKTSDFPGARACGLYVTLNEFFDLFINIYYSYIKRQRFTSVKETQAFLEHLSNL